MSTPREISILVNVFLAGINVGLFYANWKIKKYLRRTKMTNLPEGVAAPLEPTQIAARKFRIDRSINDGTMMSGSWIDAIMAEFAAAVSKNLREELALMEKKFDILMADSNAFIKQRDSRILELEKEITALREKP